jgi:hypothetical protein
MIINNIKQNSFFFWSNKKCNTLRARRWCQHRQRQFPGFSHCIEYQMNLIYRHCIFFQQWMTLKRKANGEKNDLSLILCYKTLTRVHDVFQHWIYRWFIVYWIRLMTRETFSSKKINQIFNKYLTLLTNKVRFHSYHFFFF